MAQRPRNKVCDEMVSRWGDLMVALTKGPCGECEQLNISKTGEKRKPRPPYALRCGVGLKIDSLHFGYGNHPGEAPECAAFRKWRE